MEKENRELIMKAEQAALGSKTLLAPKPKSKADQAQAGSEIKSRVWGPRSAARTPGGAAAAPEGRGKTRGSENRPEMKGQARATYINNTSEQIDPRGGRPHTKKGGFCARREAALATPKWAAEGRPRGQQPDEDESVMNWLRQGRR